MELDNDLLYGDLESTGQSAEIQNLKEALHSAQTNIKSLAEEVDDALKQIQLLLDEKETLEKNTVIVYNTALREITRKDKEIAELTNRIVMLEMR
eukprot:gene8425-17370_t